MDVADVLKEIHGLEDRFVTKEELQPVLESIKKSSESALSLNDLQQHTCEDANCSICGFKNGIYRKGVIDGAKVGAANPDADWEGAV